MFVRGHGPASAQKETRVHPHAGVPKTGWKYKGNGIRVQSPQNSAIAGPRSILNIRPIESVDGILCGLRGWEPASDFSATHDALLWVLDQIRAVLWRSISRLHSAISSSTILISKTRLVS